MPVRVKKNMKQLKKLIAVSLLFTPYSQANELVLYGRANISIQSSDDGDGAYTEINNNSSRIGLKSHYVLTDTLSILYKAEFGLDIDGDSEQGDSITDRDQYVGLKGRFGEVLLGKTNTMLKQSQGKADLFNRLNGDIKLLFTGENRMSNSLSYKSPSLAGFRVGLSYITKDQLDGNDSSSFAIFYGDKTLKKTKFYAAIALDKGVKGYDTARFTLSAKLSAFTLATILQTQQSEVGENMNGYVMSAAYKIEQYTFKAQLQRAKFERSDDKSGASIGVDYTLANPTKLYAFFTSLDMNAGIEQYYLGGGIEYQF